MNNFKILVASPTYEGMKYCQDKFFQRIKNLSYPGYDILIVENSEDKKYFNKLKEDTEIIVIREDSLEKNKMKRLINSRNKIINYALKNGYDYLLMMDSDVIPPKDIIEELLNCKKDIVSGLYFNYFLVSEKLKWLPVAWTLITKKEFEEMKEKVIFPDSVKSNLDIKAHMTTKEIESGELLVS